MSLGGEKMAYKIFIKSKFDGTIEEADDEVYQSKADAQDALGEVINNFATGAEVLELAGESFEEPDEYEFIIKRI